MIESPNISHESKQSTPFIFVKSENSEPNSPPKVNLHVDLPIELDSSIEQEDRIEVSTGHLYYTRHDIDATKDIVDTFETSADQDENSSQRRSEQIKQKPH